MSDDVTVDLLIFISRIFFLKVPYYKHKLKGSKELAKTWGLPRCKNMLNVFFVSSCWPLVIVKWSPKTDELLFSRSANETTYSFSNFEIFELKLYQGCQVHLMSSKFQRSIWSFGGVNNEQWDSVQQPSVPTTQHGMRLESVLHLWVSWNTTILALFISCLQTAKHDGSNWEHSSENNSSL